MLFAQVGGHQRHQNGGRDASPSHRSAADNEAMQGAVEPAEPAAATVER